VELVLSGVEDPVGTSNYTATGTAAILGAQAQCAALLDHMDQASRGTAARPHGWISVTGSQTKVGGTNGEPGFQARRYGFLAGLDKRFDEGTVGVALGYAATLGAGLDFLSQKRPFGTTGTAVGNHMGQEMTKGGQAILPMTFGTLMVTPRAGLRYAYFHANSFAESGAGGQDLNVSTDNVRSLQPYVGVAFDKAFGDALKPVNARLRVGYARELLDANRALNVASGDGTLFTAPGANLPRSYLTAGVSVTLHLMKNLDVSLNYDTVINTGHASVQQGNLRIGYTF
jgi:uncharacterized protein with beta-barrel porin domain